MSETHPRTQPLIISFVSGKGGVGKTMLAVACAKELSLKSRTLIVDLDFFNRGLTGLLGEGSKQCGQIDKPDFLSSESEGAAETWKIVQVSADLFHINYPDLSQDDMQKFEMLDVDVLKESLRRFIIEAASKCECNCVVVDCHGGPDNSSFAACLISEYTILVSEPDRITFYGTLNFLRQLKKVAPQDIDLRLVFNKVVPAFSGLFLNGFYNRLIKKEFGDHPLLAIFPLEVYLTKEFEKTPFLTAVYPYSWLAKKTRLLLYDLLHANHKNNLARVISSMPSWMRTYRRLSLGKTFPLINVSVIMPTIVTVGVILVLFTIAFQAFFHAEVNRLEAGMRALHLLQCAQKSPTLINDPARLEANLYKYPYEYDLPEREFRECIYSGTPYYRRVLAQRAEVLRTANSSSVPEQFRGRFDAELAGVGNQPRLFLTLQRASESIEPYFAFLAYLAALWLFLALLFNWTGETDKRFTYYFRRRRYATMSIFALIAPALWFAPLLIVAAVLKPAVDILRGLEPRSSGELFQIIVLLGLGTLMFVIVLSGQFYRVYRDVRYERHYIEDVFRFLFLVYLIVMPYLLYTAFFGSNS